VVVLVVRKGNPKGIKSFDDLINKDVSVVTPNPFSSGSARWNSMACYGSQLAEGKSPTQARDAVKTVRSKAKAQPGSGSDALTGRFGGPFDRGFRYAQAGQLGQGLFTGLGEAGLDPGQAGNLLGGRAERQRGQAEYAVPGAEAPAAGPAVVVVALQGQPADQGC